MAAVKAEKPCGQAKEEVHCCVEGEEASEQTPDRSLEVDHCRWEEAEAADI